MSLKGTCLLFYSQHNLVVLLLLISLANSSTIGSVDDSLCIGTAYCWIYVHEIVHWEHATLNILMYRFRIPPILLPVLIISSLQNPLVQTNCIKLFTLNNTWSTSFSHLTNHFTNWATAYTFFSRWHHLTITTVTPATYNSTLLKSTSVTGILPAHILRQYLH